jgi:hypothetical protein
MVSGTVYEAFQRTLARHEDRGFLSILPETAQNRFHPRTWWDSVRRSKATVLHYLGVMPAMLFRP